jgi:hypothetical protein
MGEAVVIPDHTLLQLIEEGSYGAVWLARTATGKLRAVKIVRREAFEDDRPYEREFTGLKLFEPISREHPGLVDILQVGRDDQAGFFHYVMELADDARLRLGPGAAAARAGADTEPAESGQLVPNGYQPLTLRSLIRASGRLPVKEALPISVALAEALSFLHRAGLVHRDIKPSNVVFVGGVPKLADAGLVAPVHDARSYVGTEGFVPPEGPGTPAADLYSLGKVIYEMAMGKDRQMFPSPPTMLHELPDRAELCELNEVITKACAPAPAKRYPTAEAMAVELRQLLAGGSVRRLRRRQFQRRLTGWAAVAIAVIAMLAGLGRWWAKRTRPDFLVLHQVTLPGGWPAKRALVGHFEGYGDQEIISAANGRLVAVGLNGDLLREGTLPGFRGDYFDASLLADVDGDGKQELLVTGRDRTNLFVSVFKQGLHEVKRFTAEGALEHRDSGDYPSSFMTPSEFIPATNDFPARLMVSVTSGYSIWPRYIRCYDYVTEAVAWELPVTDPPLSCRFYPTAPDGGGVFLLGGYAPDNGAQLPDGTSDSNCYLRCLTSNGRPEWSREMGGKFVRCLPQVESMGGTNFIYALVCRTTEAWLQSKKSELAFGRILKLDIAGTEKARYEVGLELSSLLLADLSGSGTPRVFATDSRGNLHVLDTDLHLQQVLPVTPTRRDWAILRAEAAADFNSDGQKELLLHSAEVEFVSGVNEGHPEGETNLRWYHHDKLLVYTPALRLLASHEIAQRVPDGVGLANIAVLSAQGDRHRDIAVLGQKATILRLDR